MQRGRPLTPLRFFFSARFFLLPGIRGLIFFIAPGPCGAVNARQGDTGPAPEQPHPWLQGLLLGNSDVIVRTCSQARLGQGHHHLHQ